MKYKIIWSKFSEDKIDEIFDFYHQSSKSYDIAQRIITKILLAPDILIDNPRIGQIELALQNREIKYHYLVESNCKIIYSVDDKNKLVKISDVFDTRQNPTKIERQK